MIEIALIGFGVWLLVATTVGLYLGKFMGVHAMAPSAKNHDPKAVQPHRRAS